MPPRPVGSRHPFRSGISALAALSAPLQGGLRFLRPRLPATPSPFLAVGLPPRWGASGLPSCRWRRIWIGSVGVCTPVGVSWMSSSSSEEGRSDPLTFWSRPVSPFGRFVVTRLKRLFTCVQPSDPSLVRLRIQGWQGPDRCPRSFGRRITPSPVRVGTPGHHRVRGGIATSFTTLLDRPCGRMHNVYVRPLVARRLLRGLRDPGARVR